MTEMATLAVGCGVGFLFLLVGAWHAVYADPKLRAHGLLVMAAGYGVLTVVFVLIHHTWGASCFAAMPAGFLYAWWTSGGGDGLRRRLKSWTARFGPKTAPQSA